MVHTLRGLGSRWPWWAGMSWLLVAIVFANAGAYIVTTANPLVSSDAWHFLDVFVSKVLDGSVTFGDLFSKRDGMDHSQPLNKLFLYVNTRYLGLDFVYEGLVGIVFAFLGFLVLAKAASSDWAGQRKGVVYYLLLAAIAAVYVSLNSSTIFSWPLVTFGYVTNFFLFATIFLAWSAYRRTGAMLWFVPVALVCAAIADDVGFLLAISLAISLLLVGAKERRFARAAGVAAVSIVAVIGYALVYEGLAPTGSGGPPALGSADRLAALAELGSHDWWRWLVIPLASSVAYFGQLSYYMPDHWAGIQIGLGVALAAAHLWFWYAALRGRDTAASFIAVNVMLLFYAYIAGIIYGRVAENGSAYLNEPRYVTFYQLSIVALLLMGLARAQGAKAPSGAMARSPGLVLAAVVLLVAQFPLSRFTWYEAQFNRQYWQTMAVQMGTLARDPDTAPKACVPLLVICQWHPGDRRRTLLLLQQHRLNLFSPDFQRRHHLTP